MNHLQEMRNVSGLNSDTSVAQEGSPGSVKESEICEENSLKKLYWLG